MLSLNGRHHHGTLNEDATPERTKNTIRNEKHYLKQHSMERHPQRVLHKEGKALKTAFTKATD